MPHVKQCNFRGSFMKFFVRAIAMTASTILLVLSSNVFAKAYKGGELYSNQSYQYGRYEIRMRTVKIR